MGVKESVNRAKTAVVAYTTHRLLNPHVSGCGTRTVSDGRVVLQFFQRRNEAWGIPRQLTGTDVGQRLTLTRDRALQECRNNRRNDDEDESDNGKRIVVAVTVVAS